MNLRSSLIESNLLRKPSHSISLGRGFGDEVFCSYLWKFSGTYTSLMYEGELRVKPITPSG